MLVNRVVVTGLGAVTPVGNSVAATWEAFLAGRSGISRISRFDVSDFAVRIAGELKGFSLNGAISPKEARHLDPVSQYAVVAVKEALEDAELRINEANAQQI